MCTCGTLLEIAGRAVDAGIAGRPCEIAPLGVLEPVEAVVGAELVVILAVGRRRENILTPFAITGAVVALLDAGSVPGRAVTIPVLFGRAADAVVAGVRAARETETQITSRIRRLFFNS